MNNSPRTALRASGPSTAADRGPFNQNYRAHGSHVIDTWCFSAEDLTEFMCMEHVRPALRRLWPQKGDPLTLIGIGDGRS